MIGRGQTMSDAPESSDPTTADPFGAVALDPALADATAAQQQSEGSTDPATETETGPAATEEAQKDASASNSGT